MRTVLIVDDEMAIRMTVAETLRDLGYEVTTAASGQEALEYLVRSRPDLILLDLMMPRLAGTELLQWMRAQLELATVPVVVMSAAVPHQLSSPVVAFLSKPFDLDQLTAVLTQAAIHPD